MVRGKYRELLENIQRETLLREASVYDIVALQVILYLLAKEHNMPKNTEVTEAIKYKGIE